MEIEKIKKIIDLMKQSELKVFSLEEGDVDLYLEMHSRETGQVPLQMNSIKGNNKSIDSPSDDSPLTDLIEIKATQVGIFYTQPEENSTETFVKVGDKVKPGDQIGLIEIMKLFNEVRVDKAGIIEEILVTNGEPVEFDQVLMLLRPEEAEV